MYSIQGTDKMCYPHEVCAEVLSKIINLANEQHGSPVRKAIITIPAYFDKGQKESW